MRRLFAVAVAGLAVAATAADDPKPKADPPATRPRPKVAEPTLKVGDKAPELKAEKWMQGDEVKGFEAGKVYVVEFWQTWCGPCIVAMPHLADLADEYRPKGVTVVGFAGVLNGDTTAKVAEFVKKKGPKLGYTFAHSPDRVTTDAWMTAAGRNGIPCSFVIDKEGKIAYIGHPMTLDPVLPAVVAGTWDAAKADDIIGAFRKDQQAAVKATNNSDAEAGVKELAALLAERPELAGAPGLTPARVRLLVRAKKFSEAEALAGAAVAKAAKRDDTATLSNLGMALAAVKARPELVALGLKAADAVVASAGDNAAQALMTASSVYKAAGEEEKAKGFAVKAVAAGEKALKGDKDWRTHLQLAPAYKAAGDAEKAKASAQKVFDHAPPGMPAQMVAQLKGYGAEPKKADDDKERDK